MRCLEAHKEWLKRRDKNLLIAKHQRKSREPIWFGLNWTRVWREILSVMEETCVMSAKEKSGVLPDESAFQRCMKGLIINIVGYQFKCRSGFVLGQ